MFGGCQTELINKKEGISEMKAGVPGGTKTGVFISIEFSLGKSSTREQQLQIQKGVQSSSPQALL